LILYETHKATKLLAGGTKCRWTSYNQGPTRETYTNSSVYIYLSCHSFHPKEYMSVSIIWADIALFWQKKKKITLRL